MKKTIAILAAAAGSLALLATIAQAEPTSTSAKAAPSQHLGEDDDLSPNQVSAASVPADHGGGCVPCRAPAARSRHRPGAAGWLPEQRHDAEPRRPTALDDDDRSG